MILYKRNWSVAASGSSLICQLCLLWPFFFMFSSCSLEVDVIAGVPVTMLDHTDEALTQEWWNGVQERLGALHLPYGRGAATPGLLHERSTNCHLCYFGCLILSAKCNPDRHFLQSVHFNCGGDNIQSSDQNGDLPWGKASWKNMLSCHDSFFFFFLVWFFSHLLIISSISPFPEHDNTFSLPYLCSCFSFCNAFSTYLLSHLIL